MTDLHSDGHAVSPLEAWKIARDRWLEDHRAGLHEVVREPECEPVWDRGIDRG